MDVVILVFKQRNFTLKVRKPLQISSWPFYWSKLFWFSSIEIFVQKLCLAVEEDEEIEEKSADALPESADNGGRIANNGEKTADLDKETADPDEIIKLKDESQDESNGRLHQD